MIKIGLVLVDAMRLYFCFHALGPQVEFGQVSVLTVSGALGAAVSIVPAGLGIREAFAAVLGPAVGLTASSAYLATSLNRVFGLAMLSPIALFLAVRQKARVPRLAQQGNDGSRRAAFIAARAGWFMDAACWIGSMWYLNVASHGGRAYTRKNPA
ncbi:lysylphosphatidylglycerol synthase domain-containing protein [Roseibium salinum]|nr:lysylphosphatidylglycerol synthase domain-containing protein [Roseibium salinum]